MCGFWFFPSSPYNWCNVGCQISDQDVLSFVGAQALLTFSAMNQAEVYLV